MKQVHTAPSPRRRARVLPVNRTSERISFIDRTPARYWTTASEDLARIFPSTRLTSTSEDVEVEEASGRPSCVSTEVWGLGNALHEDEAVEEEEEERRRESEVDEEEDKESALEEGKYEDDDDENEDNDDEDEDDDDDDDDKDDLEEPEGKRGGDWPLPLGTLTLDPRVL